MLMVYLENFVTNKIRNFTFHNANDNTNVVEKLINKLFQVCCICYIFNLIIQDDLKYIALQLTKIREPVGFVYVSSSLKQALASVHADFNLFDKIFTREIANMSNSIYLMLQFYVNYDVS